MEQKSELVKAYIQQAIAQGVLKKGQRLPGCRTIAEQLSLNKITVNKAYRQMEEAHILYSVPRGGYYLIDLENPGDDRANVIDFSTIRPDPSLIPYKAFSHAMNRSIDEHKRELFLYGDPMGQTDLRETLKQRFLQNGIYSDTAQIMITHGSQQGIYLVLKTVFHKNTEGVLLVESPTYSCVIELARDLGITYAAVERSLSGVDFKKFELLLQQHKPKAFYIMPRYQNPTGYSLMERDKVKLVELCNKYQVLIIEDDYLGDLCNDRRNLPLHYYDTHRNTFYLCSFSKSFIPGIRLGTVVIPAPYLEALAKAKYTLDICTSGIPQSTLDFYIRSGMYDQHLKKTRACYQAKLLKARGILSSMDIPDCSYHVPKQGIFLWLTLPAKLQIPVLIEQLAEKNIKIGPSEHYYPGESDNSLRLCISGVQKEDLDALYTILECIKVLLTS